LDEEDDEAVEVEDEDEYAVWLVAAAAWL